MSRAERVIASLGTRASLCASLASLVAAEQPSISSILLNFPNGSLLPPDVGRSFVVLDRNT